MSANPYAPPQAAVADIDDGTDEVQPVQTWSSQGRIGRLRYLAHLTGSNLIVTLLSMALTAGLVAVGLPMVGVVAGWVLLIAFFVFVILKTIQRSHDMGWSGWTCLIALIPLVGLIWVFKGGTSGRNAYGAPPPPNTLGVKILALMLPVIAILGILAAIALPAYQGYVKRAQQVQTR
ncbi:MAG TPA: DUF805 domain-containing protein [Ramlibacter sp.]|nr:DUF805 domain-containing protein [Ramlibacter sp.]